MKIAIVGCGALGSYYGAKLCQDGHETHFLLRSDFEMVRRHGVWVEGLTESFRVRPRCARSPEEIGPCDLVVIGLKTTANHRFSSLLPSLVTNSTVLLTLQNGLGNEENLVCHFPVEQIMGGLCFVSLNRMAPGHVRHIDGGRILFGEFKRWPEPRTHDFATAFRHAGIPCQIADRLERAHWLKLVWNIPFNGLGVAAVAGIDSLDSGKLDTQSKRFPVASTDQLLQSSEWLPWVSALMKEVCAVANAMGLDIPMEYPDQEMERTRQMGRYRASTLIDFERGQALELESLFLRPLQEAKRHEVQVPHLERLVQVLSQLDPAGVSNGMAAKQ